MANFKRMSKGVLLVNLGSPNSTSVKDVRTYLDEFLMDPRVIDLPYLSRALLVKGIILRTRPKKSAAAYEKVWTKEGSPLIIHTRNLTQKVQSQLDIPVQMAMRYGNPSIASAITTTVARGQQRVLLVRPTSLGKRTKPSTSGWTSVSSTTSESPSTTITV